MRFRLIAIGTLVVGGLSIAGWVTSQRQELVRGALNPRTYTDGGVAYRYQLFIPHDYDAARRWPVVVALHGSREKGTDGERQVRAGLGPVVMEQATTFPAVVIFPQVHPGERGASSHAMMERLIDSALREVNGDPRRVYLTGLSFGGFLTYDLALRNPGRYAALVQIATHPLLLEPDGRTRIAQTESDAAIARALRTTPIWIVHGANDPNVPVEDARRLTAVLKGVGAPVRYTEYPDGAHEVWDRAYRSPELWSWLFAQHR
jgi:predicted peptidase